MVIRLWLLGYGYKRLLLKRTSSYLIIPTDITNLGIQISERVHCYLLLSTQLDDLMVLTGSSVYMRKSKVFYEIAYTASLFHLSQNACV